VPLEIIAELKIQAEAAGLLDQGLPFRRDEEGQGLRVRPSWVPVEDLEQQFGVSR